LEHERLGKSVFSQVAEHHGDEPAREQRAHPAVSDTAVAIPLVLADRFEHLSLVGG
jgi:hypothetical protein